MKSTDEEAVSMDGLTRDEAFYLNEEIDRIDTSILDFLADEDEPLGGLTADDTEVDDF
jgi:hypothetical protein